MSHTNKFTRNARLRRFAPGSAPAENSAPPVFYGPPYAFRNYLGGEGWVAPGPPPPAPPPPGPIAAAPPLPPVLGKCSGYACGLGQEPGGGLLRQMGHVQFTRGRENRNRGLEAHRPVVFQFPKKVPKIPVALRASFQTQNNNKNLLLEQHKRAFDFDKTEYRAKMIALMAASDAKAQGKSHEEQTLVFLATLSAGLEESGMNQETREIVLEFARKERNMLDPQKRAVMVKRRKNYKNKYTKKKNNNNGYSGNKNRTRKH
jgi:hypothetical protein